MADDLRRGFPELFGEEGRAAGGPRAQELYRSPAPLGADAIRVVDGALDPEIAAAFGRTERVGSVHVIGLPPI